MDTPLQGRRALVTSSAASSLEASPVPLTPIPLPAAESGEDLYIDQSKFAVFAADVPEETAALMAATQRPIAATALEDKAGRAGWKTIPSWTLVTLEDLAVPAERRFMPPARVTDGRDRRIARRHGVRARRRRRPGPRRSSRNQR